MKNNIHRHTLVAETAKRHPKSKKSKSTHVLSIRLTSEEFAHLKSISQGLPVSDYVRQNLFSDYQIAQLPDSNTYKRLSPAERQKLLAQILVRLGKLDVTKNINLTLEAIQNGFVDISPDALEALHATKAELSALRQDLLQALGLRS